MAFVLYSATSSLGLLGSNVKAQEYVPTPCDEAQYSALTQLPQGDFNVYLRAGRKEEAVKSTIYYKTLDSDNCIELGAINAKVSDYQKVNQVMMPETLNVFNVFVEVENTVTPTTSANSPQVVFSEVGREPCDLTKGCTVIFQNQQFTLSPKKISVNLDNLRVGELFKLTNDTKTVIYTIDGKPAYTKPKLEEFNLNYVPDGEHTLSRIVVLWNGQSLTDSKVVKRGLEGGVTYLLISLIYGQSRLLGYIGAAVGLLLLYVIITYFVKRKVARDRWKKEHFFDPSEHFDISNAGGRLRLSTDESYGQLLRRYRKYLYGGLAVIGGFYLINNFAVRYFRVNGVSMLPTLQNQSRRLLNTLPVTLSKINNNYYLPQRGKVVVVEKDDNNLFENLEGNAKQYVVKRIIGLPDERVVVKNGKILVFNKDNPNGFEPDAQFKWVVDLTGSENIDIDVKLKDGEVFVVGDNRDESVDSRYYGPVSTGLVIGEVL